MYVCMYIHIYIYIYLGRRGVALKRRSCRRKEPMPCRPTPLLTCAALLPGSSGGPSSMGRLLVSAKTSPFRGELLTRGWAKHESSRSRNWPQAPEILADPGWVCEPVASHLPSSRRPSSARWSQVVTGGHLPGCNLFMKPDSKRQQLLVGIILVGRLGVSVLMGLGTAKAWTRLYISVVYYICYFFNSYHYYATINNT